ncbi:MAG: hypothetical protein ACUVXB_16020 [Bryobacteraceae bacterium]
MFASILIIVVSGALLIYWFRYTCLLLLGSKPSEERAAKVAAANGLHFQEIQGTRIGKAAPSELPALQKMLERDYQLITFLLEHAASFELGGVTLEQRLLMLDFRIMQIVSTMGRLLGVDRVRAAVHEMAAVVARLADALGERLEGTTHA